jgi:hypothetical protein
MIISHRIFLLTTLILQSVAQENAAPSSKQLVRVRHVADCLKRGLAFVSTDSDSRVSWCCPPDTTYTGEECVPSSFEDWAAEEELDEEGRFVSLDEEDCADDEWLDEDGNCVPTDEEDCAEDEVLDEEGGCIPIDEEGCADDEILDEDGNCYREDEN